MWYTGRVLRIAVVASLAVLALVAGRRATSAAPTGHEWLSLISGRHSIWRRGPPLLT